MFTDRIIGVVTSEITERNQLDELSQQVEYDRTDTRDQANGRGKQEPLAGRMQLEPTDNFDQQIHRKAAALCLVREWSGVRQAKALDRQGEVYRTAKHH